MGIALIWPDLRNHIEVKELAKLAADHYDAHNRPFRIAVDVAGWIFNNVTKEQVAHFRRTSQEAARTDVKNIYCHITILLALNIELLVVFDGKNRPPKEGRGFKGKGVPMRHERNRDLLSMLDVLDIPYYEAPGEAEAECAMLQTKGLVDAVWSEDSDTLMFGCSLLLRYHRVPSQKTPGSSQKQWHMAETLRSSEIQSRLGLDRAALVLFAMLVGGDYGKGLLHCGPALAKQLIQHGLGRSLIACKNQLDCRKWREELVQTLAIIPSAKKPNVPTEYPSYEVLKKYMQPNVSRDTDLNELSFLRARPSHIFDEKKLFSFSSGYFNQFGKLYMERITPVLLTRWMLNSGDLGVSNVHDVKIVKTRGHTDDTEAASSFVKVSFSPFGLSSLPTDTYANMWQKVQPREREFKKQEYDPKFRVTFAYAPRALIQKTLPQLLSQTPTAARTQTPLKRKLPKNAESSCERPIKITPKTRTTEHFGHSSGIRPSSTRTEPGSSSGKVRESAVETPSKMKASVTHGGSSKMPGNLEILTLSDTDGESESEQVKGSVGRPMLEPRSRITMFNATSDNVPAYTARPEVLNNKRRVEVVDLTEDWE